ncbi:MAG TPA: type IV toxin-antitoxin system AbiEi family antitoxin [Spirochaetota bacterium]|nr:type IV toxin-antitoxin system AbiEi family antitoxin [Spirochaetota bacterium]
MNIKHSKTLGPRESRLITSLYEANKQVFKLKDVKDILAVKEAAAANIVSRLNAKGIITRVKQGLYSIVPFDMGKETVYAPDANITAREIMDGKDYYIAFASALQLHDMTTQPQLTNYTAVLKQKPQVKAAGYEYKFVNLNKKSFFGIEDFWINKQEKIKISDPEKTIIDCLNHPEYCGGVSEAAKAMYIKKDSIIIEKLVDYAVKLDKGSVCARLGYLLELYKPANDNNLNLLRQRPGKSYVLLDPTMPKSGKYLNRWRLLLNVDMEELSNIGRT